MRLRDSAAPREIPRCREPRRSVIARTGEATQHWRMSENGMRLVYFRADWCGVCHEKNPVVDRLAAAAGLPLDVVDWESEDGQTRAIGLRIQTVPTLALVDGERVRFRLVGKMITPETAAHLIGMYRPARDSGGGGDGDG
jgi:thiol-disulfide isomerase/thioredoxin